MSTPEQTARLYRVLAEQTIAWPTSTKADEMHTAGLYMAVRDTAQVDGAIVECGVGRGRSLVSLARAAALYAPTKQVYGFDSFAGFPPAVEADLGERVTETGGSPPGWTDTSLDLVRAALDEPAELVPGFFEASLPERAPGAISLLHVDCDMYDSTATVLRHCLPRMTAGGLVVFDEYDEPRWPGATKAVDEAVGAERIEWAPSLGRYVARIR